MSPKSARRFSSSDQTSSLIGVSMAPGATAFTRMPSAATSCARLFMSMSTPPFAAA